jgi:hypothetical protein
MTINIQRSFIPVLILLIQIVSACTSPIREYTTVESLPKIYPDYTSLVIPSNIAPLNFHIEAEGSEYYVEIYSQNGNKIRLRQSSPSIIIPLKKWQKLLSANQGNTLSIDVYAKQEQWVKYATITDSIAREPIDSHLVYRLISLVHTDGDKLGIYQQNLENYETSAIIENVADPKRACINCHAFSNNNPDKMSMHIRKGFNGTVILDQGKYTKFNTKTERSLSPAAHTAWHPNGQLIAFSCNYIYVYFTNDDNKLVEVVIKPPILFFTI